MKKILFILLFAVISCTSSIILIKKSNNVEVKVDENTKIEVDSNTVKKELIFNKKKK